MKFMLKFRKNDRSWYAFLRKKRGHFSSELLLENSQKTERFSDG